MVVDPTKRGALVILEGPDGVGKSILAGALTSKLAALNVPCTHAALPGDAEATLGRLVNRIHHHPEEFGLEFITPNSLQALHIAAHLDMIERSIEPALKQGRWVVLERCWWSTWVYGICAGGDPQTLDALAAVERQLWAEIQPDVVFLVDRTSAESDTERLGRIREGYEELATSERGKYPIRRVANNGSIEEALDLMLEHLSETLEAHTGAPAEAKPPADQATVPSPARKDLPVITSLSPVRPTVVYDSFWRFAAERQAVFFRKLEGEPPPWTEDPIIARYKFTNAYRASDRVSQYLIRHVIYEGDPSPEEVFFRTILFKIFNKIETWELLSAELGPITLEGFSYDRYDQVLARAMAARSPIYSAAYIMPSGKGAFGHREKHRNHLRLLETMMRDRVAYRIADASSMKEAFEILRSYPTIGDFLAYQYVTDLNYSELCDFSETEFVVAGPGAKDGLRKCFSDRGGLTENDMIRLVTERQELEFSQRGLVFRSLWGRPLQLIDCQNLFCEVSKYARVAHPTVRGTSERRRIKQQYRPTSQAIAFRYPPKWRINHLVPDVIRPYGLS